MQDLPVEAVIAITEVEFTVVEGRWPAGVAAADAVECHWRKRLAESPKMFNGRVFVITELDVSGGRLAARFVPTDFKTFLSWREGVFTDMTVRDGFVFGLLRDADGGIVLGRQSAGHLNAGFAYPPAGFIDAADVGPDGRIDVVGSIRRELGEEMGLSSADVVQDPGFLAVFCGPIVAIGVPFTARMSPALLIKHVRAHIARETESELDDVVIVTAAEQVDAIPMTPHAALAVQRILAGEVDPA